MHRIKASPFIPHTDAVRGFVYDVATGRLREVSDVPAQPESAGSQTGPSGNA